MDYSNPNELLPPQQQQQHHQPQSNHPYENPSPSAPPQSWQTTPMQATGWPIPQVPQTHGPVMIQSNEPNNQHAIYQQQQQAIYEQPRPPSYPQNIVHQPFASTYQVPPQYVVMAPYFHQVPIQHVEGWKTGLFDCMDDPTNALITVCFPCVTFGQVAEIVDEGRTSCATSGLLYGLIALLIGIPCILSIGYRTKLRSNFGLAESVAPDWVIHCLCDCCALCQEYRELHQGGWDPSIGWHGNLARRQNMQRQQQIVMMAPMNQTMMG